MIIHEPEIVTAYGEVFLQAHIETDHPNTGLPEFLWFSYPEYWSDAISTRADSFLSAMLLVAMTIGEDIECRGELSPRLCFLLGEYQKIFSCWQPDSFHPIQVYSDKMISAPVSQNDPCYATTFSGGVDSFFTLYELLNPTSEKPNWPIKYAFFYARLCRHTPVIHPKIPETRAPICKCYPRNGDRTYSSAHQCDAILHQSHCPQVLSGGPTIRCCFGIGPSDFRNIYADWRTVPEIYRLYSWSDYHPLALHGEFRILQSRRFNHPLCKNTGDIQLGTSTKKSAHLRGVVRKRD